MDHDYCIEPRARHYLGNDYQDDNDTSSTFNEVDCTQNILDGDSILISLVQSHPYLYNKQLSDFKDSVKKENAWVEIARILNMKGM